MRWLLSNSARAALRESIDKVRARYPFVIDAWVLLPDHLHCIWTLPKGDDDFSTRWRLIKSAVTKKLGDGGESKNTSRSRRKEADLWQRRFWEHRIRDDCDYATHCDYIHYNPVRHGLVDMPKNWPYSTFHKFMKEGMYPPEWCDGGDMGGLGWG
jgi:putative transposase